VRACQVDTKKYTDDSFRNPPSVQILIAIAFFSINMTGIYDHTKFEEINDICLGEVLWDCKSSTDQNSWEISIL